MSSFEEELRRLLDDVQSEEWKRAVEALQVVFAWCAEAATPQAVTCVVPDDSTPRMQALTCLLQLCRALEEGKKYLELLPDFLRVAEAGEDLRSKLASYQEEFQGRQQQLAQMEAELKQLTEQEEELREQVRQKESLQRLLEEHKSRLERLIRLAHPQVVQDLQVQVEELQKRMPPEGKEVEQLEQRVLEGAQRLIVLHEKHLKAISPQVVLTLQQAEAKEQELRELSVKLQQARSRYEQASPEVRRLLEELKPYIEADCMVAQAIPEATGVLDLLTRAESLVKTAEEALKHTIEESERNAQRHPLSITGEVIPR